MATDGTWNGGTGNWDTSSNWQNDVEPTPDGNATATAGVVIVTNDDDVGGLNFSGSAELEVNGGILDVGGNGNANGTVNLDLGSGGAVLQSGALEVEDSFNGTASGTVYLEGAGAAFYWQPQLSNYPGPATAANSTNLTVDFNDGGQAATFGVSAAFNGQVAGFQSGDYITWAFATGPNDPYTATFGNNSVTLTDNEQNSVTINFSGASNQYNSSDLVVTDGYLLTTTYVPPAPEVAAATYDASTGKLVVTAAGNGDNFTTSAGDFDPTQLSLTGENGLQYTLTGGAVSAVSSTSFTVTLTSADQLQVDGLLDNNGASSTGNGIFNNGAGPTSYVIAASASFDVGGRASSGGVTVSNALTPTISSVTYDPSSGLLTLNGTDFEDAGGFGGINLGQITLSDNSGGSFTFDAQDYGNATSATQATIDLSNTTPSNQQEVQSGEEATVNNFFGASGPFTLAATSGWDAGAGAAITSQSVTLVGAAPTITSESYSSPGGADIDANNTVAFTVNFSSAVTVTGSPTLSLTGNRSASLTSGSGTTALTFGYTVQPGDNVSDLEATAFNLNNGTIQHGGLNADLSGFTTINTGVQLDTTAPSATSIALVSSSPNNAGSESYTVTFSESVTGVDNSDFTAVATNTVADTGITVTPVSGSVYTVTVDGVTGDGTLGLNLNSSGTAIADAAGNAISGGFTGAVYTIDHSAPTLTLTGASVDAFQGGAALAALASTAISDPDGPGVLTGATATITNAQAGDELSIAGISNGTLDNGAVTITGNNSSTLTLSGDATIAKYQTLLGEVTYQDTGDDTTTIGSHPSRTLDWTVSNVWFTSPTVATALTIDRPPNQLLNDLTAVEGQTLTGNTGDTDPDGDIVTLTALTGGAIGAPLQGVYGTLTLDANGDYTYVAGATQQQQTNYTNAPTGSGPFETFSYVASDSLGATTMSTIEIDLPRPPVLSLGSSSVVYQPGANAVRLQTSVAVSDADFDPADDEAILYANIQITGGAAAGDEIVDASGHTHGAIAGTGISYFVSAPDTLTLFGPDSASNFAAALSDFYYTSTAADPTDGGLDTTRTLTYTVYGGDGVLSAAHTETVDIVPLAPTNLAVSGQPVNGQKVTITGSGEAGDAITLFNGAIAIGTGAVGSGGTFSVTTSAALADGVYSVTAKQTDSSDVSSLASSALTVDVNPSAPTNLAVSGQPVNGQKITITGSGEAGDAVALYNGATAIGTGTVGSGGTFSVTTTAALADGVYSLTAKETDSSHLTSLASSALTVDINPSAPKNLAVSGQPVNGQKVTITGSGEVGDAVTLYNGATAIGTGTVGSGGTFSVTTTAALADGVYSVTAKETDSSHLTSLASSALTVDVNPTAPTNLAVSGQPVNGQKVTVTGSGEAGDAVTLYNGATAIGTGAVGSGGTFSVTTTAALADGVYSLTAKETDSSRLTSLASSALTVDIKPTAPTNLAVSGQPVNGQKVTITGSGEAGDTVTLYNGATAIGTGAVGSGGTFSVTTTAALADGVYSLTAKETDSSHLTSLASTALTVDVDPTAPTIATLANATGSGVNETKHNLIELSGNGEAGDTMKLYVDGNATAIGSGVATVAGSFDIIATSALADGLHSLKATETDSAGLTSALSSAFSVTVDTSPPKVTVNASATIGATTGSRTAVTFSGGVTDNLSVSEVEIFNGGADLGVATLNGSIWTFATTLSAGVYKALTAVATDGAGNAATAPALFRLHTGVGSEPYSAIESLLNSNSEEDAQDFFNADGSLYFTRTIASRAGGGTSYTYSGGSYFEDLSYSSVEDIFNSAGGLTTAEYFEGDDLAYRQDLGVTGQSYTSDEIVYGVAGQPYASYETFHNSAGVAISQDFFNTDSSLYFMRSIAPSTGGGTSYTYSGGSYFEDLSYSSLEDIFNSAGGLTTVEYFEGNHPAFRQDFGVAGQPYTSDEIVYGVAGQPYKSYETFYNSAGDAISQDFFNADSSLFYTRSISPAAGDGTNYTYSGGSYFENLSYLSVEEDLTSSNQLLDQIYDNRDGSHTIIGFADNLTLTSHGDDTFTGGDSGETFLFKPDYGNDTITDFSLHLTGAGHDTISLPSSEFANFSTLLSDAKNHGGNVVITAPDADALTLANLTTAKLSTLSADFTFHG